MVPPGRGDPCSATGACHSHEQILRGKGVILRTRLIVENLGFDPHTTDILANQFLVQILNLGLSL